MPPSCSIILDLPGFKLLEVSGRNLLTLRVEYVKAQSCPRCDHQRLRIKDTFWRRIRHIHLGQRPTWIEVKSHKYSCYRCKTYFNSRFEGIKKYRRVTEPGRDEIAKLHHGGFTKAEIAQKFRLGTASVGSSLLVVECERRRAARQSRAAKTECKMLGNQKR